MSRAIDSLIEAHAERAQKAVETSAHVHAAPALFSPEFRERLEAEYSDALGWHNYWWTQRQEEAK